MAINYRIVKRKGTIKSENDYHILHAVTKGEVDTERLAYEISNQCSLHEADVAAVLIALGKQLKFHLEDGKTVHLDNIGRFKIGFRSVAKERAEDLKPSDIHKFIINYQPTLKLKSWLKGGLSVRKEK